MEYFYKTEGNILYSDKSMLTWGPFYYHSKKKAEDKMEIILQDITNWCNMKDPSLDISPRDIIRPRSNNQIIFKILAWKDEKRLQECNGIITVELVNFEDYGLL